MIKRARCAARISKTWLPLHFYCFVKTMATPSLYPVFFKLVAFLECIPESRIR